MRTYIVIVGKHSGYILDVYPNERERNLKYYRGKIFAECDSFVAAEKELANAMAAKCAKLNIEHWWKS